MIETKQELFDKVWQGLAGQDWQRSVVSGGKACRYRTADGLKCAVGLLVPDDKYDPTFEGASLDSETRKGEKVREIVSGVVRTDLFDFLTELQYAHDESRSDKPGYELKTFVTEVGEKYKLAIPA